VTTAGFYHSIDAETSLLVLRKWRGLEGKLKEFHSLRDRAKQRSFDIVIAPMGGYDRLEG